MGIKKHGEQYKGKFYIGQNQARWRKKGGKQRYVTSGTAGPFHAIFGQMDYRTEDAVIHDGDAAAGIGILGADIRPRIEPRICYATHGGYLLLPSLVVQLQLNNNQPRLKDSSLPLLLVLTLSSLPGLIQKCKSS